METRSATRRSVRLNKVKPPRPRRSISEPAPVPDDPNIKVIESLHQKLIDGVACHTDVSEFLGHVTTNGRRMESQLKDRLDGLFDVIRLSMVESQMEARTRMHLLQLIELRAGSWQVDESRSNFYKHKCKCLGMKENLITLQRHCQWRSNSDSSDSSCKTAAVKPGRDQSDTVTYNKAAGDMVTLSEMPRVFDGGTKKPSMPRPRREACNTVTRDKAAGDTVTLAETPHVFDIPDTVTCAKTSTLYGAGEPQLNTHVIPPPLNVCDIPLPPDTWDIPSRSNTHDILPLSNTHDIPLRSNAHDIPLRSNARDISPRSNAHDIPPRSNACDIPPRSNAQDISPSSNARDISPRSNAHNIPPRHDIQPRSNARYIPRRSNVRDIPPRSGARDIAPPLNARVGTPSLNTQDTSTELMTRVLPPPPGLQRCTSMPSDIATEFSRFRSLSDRCFAEAFAELPWSCSSSARELSQMGNYLRERSCSTSPEPDPVQECITYTPEVLLSYAESPHARMPPQDWSYLSKIFPEVCHIQVDDYFHASSYFSPQWNVCMLRHATKKDSDVSSAPTRGGFPCNKKQDGDVSSGIVRGGFPCSKSQDIDSSAEIVRGGFPCSKKQNIDSSAEIVRGGFPCSKKQDIDSSAEIVRGGFPCGKKQDIDSSAEIVRGGFPCSKRQDVGSAAEIVRGGFPSSKRQDVEGSSEIMRGGFLCNKRQATNDSLETI